MKKALLTAIAIIALYATANAAPMYYTFEGNVSGLNGYVSGINIGDSVSYTFLADTSLQGSYTRYDGTVVPISDSPVFDYFYDEYVSGSLLPDSGFYNNYNCPGCAASYNHGYLYSYSNPYGTYSGVRFYGGSSYNSQLDVQHNGTSQINIGDTYDGRNFVYNTYGQGGDVRSNLTLSSIIPVSQVPEPSTLLLFGSGLLGIMAFGKRLGRKTKEG